MHILAATDFSTRSQRALRRAAQLAQAKGAELSLIKVVDEDQPQHLVEMEMKEAERVLGELISSMGRPIVMSGDPFDGILRAAAAQRADIIVMGTHRKRFLRDIFVGTTIERVIRTGGYPVLMVNNEVDGPYETVLAAVDLSDASANAIRAARTMGLLDEAHLTILHAFLPSTEGRMRTAGISEERQEAKGGLTRFLAENDLGMLKSSLRLKEGGALEAISDVVDQMGPDLLVIGTHGHSGLQKALLGSVCEEVLRSLSLDILAVPPADRRYSSPPGRS